VIDHEAIALRVKVRDKTQLEHQPGDEEPVSKLLELMDDGLFYELGLMLPPVEFEEDSELAPMEIEIWINDMPLSLRAGLAPGEMLVNDTPDRLKLEGIAEARAASNPANGNPSSIVKASDDNMKAVKQTGLTAWGSAGYLVLVLSAAVRRYAGALWTVDSTDAALFLLRNRVQALVDAVDARFDRVLLTQILRSLLDEEVSVRNLPAILESMLAIDSVSNHDDRDRIAFPPAAGNIAINRRATSLNELGVNDWVTSARIRLARYLSHKYTRGQSTLIVYLLAPEVEAELEEGFGISPQAPLSPENHMRLFRAINAEIRTSEARAVILTTQSVRRTLRDLVSKDFPDVTVLCYQELSPEMNIQPIARITWPLL
jgi:type III secretion protein V